ncbi:hypothetical protein QBC37DRAFT_385454 [Rhypophila decipiens]|uniref:Uncharacterized protein n=1 Tax=Rhypophila decipiens TaxID=261697 RepID=A0AAN6YD03_9PEZI|nr:hypothetical protein QBC37DRAFT_385454 [Rhypophila decipiens]
MCEEGNTGALRRFYNIENLPYLHVNPRKMAPPPKATTQELEEQLSLLIDMRKKMRERFAQLLSREFSAELISAAALTLATATLAAGAGAVRKKPLVRSKL